jgi:hypothetical protein
MSYRGDSIPARVSGGATKQYAAYVSAAVAELRPDLKGTKMSIA